MGGEGGRNITGKDYSYKHTPENHNCFGGERQRDGMELHWAGAPPQSKLSKLLKKGEPLHPTFTYFSILVMPLPVS